MSDMTNALRVGDWVPTLSSYQFTQFGAFPPTVIITWGSTTVVHFIEDPRIRFKRIAKREKRRRCRARVAAIKACSSKKIISSISRSTSHKTSTGKLGADAIQPTSNPYMSAPKLKKNDWGQNPIMSTPNHFVILTKTVQSSCYKSFKGWNAKCCTSTHSQERNIQWMRDRLRCQEDTSFLHFASEDNHSKRKMYPSVESEPLNRGSKPARAVAPHQGKTTSTIFSCMMIGTAPSRGQGEKENPYSTRPGTKNYQALPEDSSELQQLTQRAGANTRLKSAAMSLVAADESSREQDLMLHLPLDFENEEARDAEVEEIVAPSAMPSEPPLHQVSPHFTNMAGRVTIKELMRPIEERDSQMDQMATQMSAMIDAMNRLLQQQQQQTLHPSAQQSHSTGQAADANPHNTEHQTSPYQQSPTVNEPTAFHEVPISSMTPSVLQQLIDDIVTSKVKQLSQDKEPLLTEGDKPYPAWHDHVPYPPNYNRPRFQMFDGAGDVREHLIHFEAACGDVATNPSLLLRQFSLSLKGAAFQWYSRLTPGSVLDWDMMKAHFKTRFTSIKREVSLGELAELKQGRDEKVEDYVARWRNMIILYPDELKPTQAVELCIKGMQSWYSMEVSRYKPSNITELIKAAGMVELEYQRSPEILALYKNAKVIDNTKGALLHYDASLE